MTADRGRGWGPRLPVDPAAAATIAWHIRGERLAMHFQKRSAPWALMVLGLAAMVSGGCGAASESGLVPVSGKITLDGGSWPRPGKITFVPKGGEGNQIRPASADFDTSGNFTVSSYDGAKGLYPGEYWISVECWEELPGMANPDAAKQVGKSLKPGAGKSAVPKMYQNHETSKLALKVESSGSPTANFDVKSK